MTMMERLQEAMNAHDASRQADLFAEDYRSESLVHPSRNFTGRAQVLQNWSSVFAGVPDFRASLVRSTVDGVTEWGEWVWTGHHRDGTPFAMAGVIIAVVRDDQIADARLHMEPVEPAGDDIEAAVRELYRDE